MRFRGVLFFFMAGCLIHLSGCQKAQYSGGPASPLCSPSSIEFSSTLLDIGLIVPGNQYAYSVSFRNTGAFPVDIRLVRTSTPHLAAQVTPSRLKPGMAGELKIKFSPQMWPPGPFTTSVVLYSNDAADQVATVKVAGIIRYPIIWEPISLEFTVQKGKPAAAPPRIQITPRGANALGPLKITPKVSYLSAKAEPDPSSKSFSVTTSVDPSAPIGEYTGTIEIETNNPTFPLLPITVRYQVLGELRTVPEAMDFGFIEEGKPAEAHIAVESHAGREVQILKIEPTLPVAATVNFSRLDGDGVRYAVDVRISSPPALKELKGHLTVFTDHPEQPLISIPVKGWVWARKPFDRLPAGQNDFRLFDLTKAALEREDLLSPEDVIVKILGDRRDDPAVSLLERTLGDDDWFIRTRTVQVLGRMGNTSPP